MSSVRRSSLAEEDPSFFLGSGLGKAGRWQIRWPGVPTNRLLIAVALYLATTQNLSFAKAVLASLSSPLQFHDLVFLATLCLVLVCLLVIVLVPFSQRRMAKPALMVILVVASACSYFMDSFGVVIDGAMITNVLETDLQESAELLQPAFFLHLLVQGLLPAYVVHKLFIPGTAGLRETLHRAALMAAAVVTLAAGVLLQYQDFSFWSRNNRDVRLLVNPVYPVYAAIKTVHETLKPVAPRPAPIALDATRLARRDSRPLLVVLVLGETARSGNFQLNGYARPTNPALSRTQGLINYSAVRSCGTSTAQSLPCMFSGLERAHFSRDKASKRENLLDVLKRVGVGVTWRDNNSGCKGVCSRIGLQKVTKSADPALCNADGCYDAALLEGLEESLPEAGDLRLQVLHQHGSHGPSYFRRYPESFRRFRPDCRIDSVQHCSREEIVNAYDNTILYTDAVLADLIDRLQRQADKVDSVLLYVSDHGESLGESGIYLHGLPYGIAPEEQKTIPMMAWFSTGAARSLDLDLSCIDRSRHRGYSHDNLFSSLLGLFGVQTAAYSADKDLFFGCRRSTQASAAPGPLMP